MASLQRGAVFASPMEGQVPCAAEGVANFLKAVDCAANMEVDLGASFPAAEKVPYREPIFARSMEVEIGAPLPTAKKVPDRDPTFARPMEVEFGAPIPTALKVPRVSQNFAANMDHDAQVPAAQTVSWVTPNYANDTHQPQQKHRTSANAELKN